jgi:hypothetical protein
MKFRFPADFICLQTAHETLSSAYSDNGDAGPDQIRFAARRLREPIVENELDLYAILSSATPTRLTEQRLIEAASFPADRVLTFYGIDRRDRSFGLSWEDLKKLSRDPLCLDKKAFRTWLAGEVRRVQKQAGRAWKSPGRPSEKRDQTIKALEALQAQGKLKARMPAKQLYALLTEADPSLEVSLDTVLRAKKAFLLKKRSPSKSDA